MLNQLFISDSFAQASDVAASSEFSFSSFVPLIAIFAIFYFLIVRPQGKKIKEHQAMVDALKIGNKVITNSGIFGVVKDIDQKENVLEVEIAEGVVVRILKNHVTDLIKPEDKKDKKVKSKK